MPEKRPPIVVGVAGTDRGSAAVQYALHEARRTGSGIHLVHVLHPMLAGPADAVSVDARQPIGLQAQRALDALATDVRAELGPELPVRASLVVGQPAAVLVEAGASASRIVLEPTSRRDRHLPTYSVTRSVVAHSRRPVVSVPADVLAPEPTGVVAVGIDEIGSSAQVLRSALEEARARHASLRVLHTWQYSAAYDDLVFEGARMDEHSADLAADLRQELKPLMDEFGDVAVELTVRHGHAAYQLVDETGNVDLLVLGRHRSGRRVSEHLGSVVRTVLHYTRCPVLVVDPVDPMWVVEDARP